MTIKQQNHSNVACQTMWSCLGAKAMMIIIVDSRSPLPQSNI